MDRTADGTGAIADMDSAEIDRLDACLHTFRDRAGFYLVVKAADTAAIGALIARLGIAARCMTSSFDAGERAGMRRDAPGVAHMIDWGQARRAADA